MSLKLNSILVTSSPLNFLGRCFFRLSEHADMSKQVQRDLRTKAIIAHPRTRIAEHAASFISSRFRRSALCFANWSRSVSEGATCTAAPLCIRTHTRDGAARTTTSIALLVFAKYASLRRKLSMQEWSMADLDALENMQMDALGCPGAAPSWQHVHSYHVTDPLGKVWRNMIFRLG